MLLTRPFHLVRSLRSLRSDDRGVALGAVLAFMAAGILFSAVVATSVVAALQFSSTTRAGVQSQAAAEAGIAVARAALISGGCAAPARYTSEGTSDDPDTTDVDESTPAYDAQIQYYVSAGDDWVDGCPPSVAYEARIISTGFASSPGIAVDDSGDSTVIEARLGSVEGESALNPSGPAVYSYNTSGFGGSGKLISSGNYDTSVMIRSGNVNCNGAANGAADLVLKSGTFTAGGSCVVQGNVWVNGPATVSGGGQIGGSLTAGSVDATGSIGGNVWSDSTLRLGWGGNVTGWASGSSLEVAGGQVGQGAWARTGSAILSGGSANIQASSLTMSGGTLTGGRITGSACFNNGSVSGPTRVGSISSASGCYTPSGQSWWGGWSNVTVGSSTLDPSPGKPSAVIVPEWVDFGSDPADYTAAAWNGHTLYTMGSDCSDSRLYQALQVIGSNPGLIDARSCSGGLTFSGGSAMQTGQGENANGFKLSNDLAIIGHEISWSGSSRLVADSPVEVWFINPDWVPNGTPDCNGQRNQVGGGFTTTNVNLMFYTPCAITLASSQNLKGQIFAGSDVKIEGAGILDYVPIGIPGYDLDTGLDDGVTSTEADRPLLWQRNLTDDTE